MNATLDQIEATANDALDQAGGNYQKAVEFITYEIKNLPIKPALKKRYSLAKLALLRREREELICIGQLEAALLVAIQIDRARGLY